jgi:hypothetical protein
MRPQKRLQEASQEVVLWGIAGRVYQFSIVQFMIACKHLGEPLETVNRQASRRRHESIVLVSPARFAGKSLSRLTLLLISGRSFRRLLERIVEACPALRERVPPDILDRLQPL